MLSKEFTYKEMVFENKNFTTNMFCHFRECAILLRLAVAPANLCMLVIDNKIVIDRWNYISNLYNLRVVILIINGPVYVFLLQPMVLASNSIGDTFMPCSG